MKLFVEVKVPKKLFGKRVTIEMKRELMEKVHRHVRTQLKERDNYNFQYGNRSPWGKGEDQVQTYWRFEKHENEIICRNDSLKAIALSHGTRPYCSRYIKSGSPKNWTGPKKMHFWYQGEEMFRYCVLGIPPGSSVTYRFNEDIKRAAEDGVDRAIKYWKQSRKDVK